MELHLKITGVSLILLALIHLAFPSYFNWKKEMRFVSLINRQLLYVHAFFIAFAVLLTGILCITSAGELLSTTLGKRICFGIGIFWLVRLFFQFFIYSSQLWKGKKKETIIHIAFSMLWTYISVIFMLASFY